MTIIEEINFIANRHAELGLDVPVLVLMSLAKYNQLMKENNPGWLSSDNTGGYTSMAIYHLHGYAKIKVDPILPDHHVSMGRMTKDDILVEDILLGED